MKPTTCGECEQHRDPDKTHHKKPWCRRLRVACEPDAKPCRLPEAVKRDDGQDELWGDR